ncbi:MAG TPA: phosphotriesterase-related protein [Coprothermobacter proteolyticus]|uniref:Putative phosphotriesterase n=1 Tax=Coprothermobacter proteolyticus (strain ATCC 35245 / DSM 5265 / OCM 4 / BT) TaxID=309798 RepID=B5Y6L2_COPPD|nr:phosphotriesterase-related protein [Coprothermobacter proteolyticus]ACI17748.1 hydrolase [Coprothermobacter proteolyticus DSM 5265]HRC95467.1 phosphotriesterase-related protein [Coprothermobacter proteolyticus]HUM44106.1 phosphotriesterase-related protein [Fervidobacterium sp.]
MESVLGNITALGKTLAHEHLTINLSFNKSDDSNLNDDLAMLEDLKDLKAAGVDTIIDVTNIGMGRNIERMRKLSIQSGMNVIASTGYYKSPYLPSEVEQLSVEQLCSIMELEITKGIDGTEIKAALIGEIGTSDQMTDSEKKVFEAAALAHLRTGVPIYTHTTLGKLGIEQIEFLINNGVNPAKVVIGHLDLNPDMEYYKRVADYGCYMGFDTVGKISYQPDEIRAKNIAALVKLGFGNSILLSLDITRKSHLKSYGGYGHVYLFEKFIPMLYEQGLTSQDVDRLLIDNPSAWFLQ